MVTQRDTIVNREILTLVKTYCGSKVITRFIADQKRIQRMEKKVLGKNSTSSSAAHVPETNLHDTVSFDHLLTVCKNTLKAYEYQEVLLGIGNIYKTHAIFHQAEKMYNEVLTFGEKHRQNDFVAEALLRRGEVYSCQGRWRESNTDLEQSRTLFVMNQDMASLAKLENILGTSLAEQGLMHEANDHFSKALRNSEQSSQKMLSAMIFMNLGIIQNILGNWDEALNNYHRALTLFEVAGDMTRAAEIHHNIGMSYLSKGDFVHANREFDRSLEYSSRLHNPALTGLAKLGKATVHFRSYDLALALALCNQALENFKTSQNPLGVADAYKVKGMILRELKEYDLAETHFQSSLRLNEEFANMLNLGETHYEMGIMEKHRRRSEAVAEAFSNALSCFNKVGARVEIERTKQELEHIERKRT
ncbi:MAG: tetratricopeptide repeat protein [Ignavibacteria bacterium]|nr:tetratricopeptide repeat protein [Ignavibacteria bacterium]